ncbi:MAG: CPBP family intramembrane metalloprotease [Gammaproteobacteria bacterium]|jgi:membrane protease YdiL (CAAX protease family)|nr:CPBP family intramembrane metalloprotease [Gammaproteobacteria bacterium]MDP6695156.1 CPBP family intramembrane metalloprotease [Gammaproteobacteria bacterium]
MNAQTLRTLVGSVVVSLVFFAVVMGISMVCVSFNARWSPDVVWFPVPVIVLLVVSTIWAEKRWHIDLSHPTGISRTQMYAVGVALTVFGVCVTSTQGIFTDKVRAIEVYSADVSPLFQMAYAFVMSVFAAILAEVTFRGIMQTRMHTVLNVWPTIFIVTFINLVAHRWTPELVQNAFGTFVILGAWTYLRWLTRSLWPPLVVHGLCNLVFALWVWFVGPIYYAELSGMTIALIVGAGLVSLAVTVFMTRKILGSRPADQIKSW